MVKPTINSGRSGCLILLLLKARSEFLSAFLRRNGYDVSEVPTPDNLVALCMNNPIYAVILDICELGEIEGWSVAQSIKMVNPALAVILLCHGAVPEVELPTGVDALATDSDLPGLLMILARHIEKRVAAHN